MKLKDFLNSGAFNQKSPCSDCPFRKKGGVRHGLAMMYSYISYFWTGSKTTFPCHRSVDKATPRDQWTEWQPGQTLCAGGLIFAKKQGRTNFLIDAGIAAGVYDPTKHTDEESVFDTADDMLAVAEDRTK